MNMKQEKHFGRLAKRGEISIKNIIFALLALVVGFFIFRAFFGTVKEASVAVSDRNKNAIEARKALVTGQTERIKNTREAQRCLEKF